MLARCGTHAVARTRLALVVACWLLAAAVVQRSLLNGKNFEMGNLAFKEKSYFARLVY